MPLLANSSETIDITVCIIARHRLYQLASFYERLVQYVRDHEFSYELIVVASGLEAQEEERLKRFEALHGNENGKLEILNIRQKTNKAGSLRAVRALIHGRLVLIIETAGGDIHMSDLDSLTSRLREGYDLVNGVRTWAGEPMLNRAQSSCFNWLTRLVTRTKVRDLNSTVKLLKREVLQGIPLYGDFYRFMPILAERRGFKVSDVGVSRREGQRSGTFYGPISYIRRALQILNVIFVTRFTEKPLRFFGGWGVAALFFGILINGMVVFERFFMAERMADRPMLLLGILLIVIGVQLISVGLIGEMIIYAKTKDFMEAQVWEENV